jgi:hypothetical protein
MHATDVGPMKHRRQVWLVELQWTWVHGGLDGLMIECIQVSSRWHCKDGIKSLQQELKSKHFKVNPPSHSRPRLEIPTTPEAESSCYGFKSAVIYLVSLNLFETRCWGTTSSWCWTPRAGLARHCTKQCLLSCCSTWLLCTSCVSAWVDYSVQWLHGEDTKLPTEQRSIDHKISDVP